MSEICQKSLADAPWMEEKTRSLPGMQLLNQRDWITVDDAYAAQMAERSRLLEEYPSDVLQISDDAVPAAQELLQSVVDHVVVDHGFEVVGDQVTRPDGVRILLDFAKPLETLCQIVTEDFCILEKQGAEHVMTAGLLCFPASWTLAEKFGHPLVRIHKPVANYTDDVARRVQRLFDAVRVDKPMWRANALRYSDPTLYQPRPEVGEQRKKEQGHYIRSERQSISRLPKTDAVVFTIHTRIVRAENLTPAQAAALRDHPIDMEEKASL